MAFIALHDVRKTYRIGKRELTVLRNVTLNIERGEFVAVMGPSGSGKSTLMHILGCLDTPSSGTYRLGEHTVSALPAAALVRIRREQVGFIFQSFNLLPRLTAFQNVQLPLIYSGRGRRAGRAREMLERVGLADRAAHRPNELSGGEQQRVAIARALVNNPSMILADEPTGNLDSATGTDIMTLFRSLHAQGTTIVIVTHDADLARYAQRTTHIRDGILTHAEHPVP